MSKIYLENTKSQNHVCSMISFETIFPLDMYKEVILLRYHWGLGEAGTIVPIFYISGVVKCFTSSI